MNIAVVGTGYVGLVAGSCFAESGNDVVCVDNNTEKIENLKKGIIPIYEPGLPEIVDRNLREERLTFSTDLGAAVKKSLVIFVAVGTPTSTDGSADLTAVFEVGKAIGRAMDRYKVIVVKSTVPVGTNSKLRETIKKETNHQFDVLSNPEFLKQGAAVDDFMKPDRVVVGADDVRAAEILRDLYAPFVRTGSPVLIVDVRTAEMLKYAANAFLASRISFMNEIATLCEKVGADVEMIRKGMAADSRIGPAFLFAGLGFGGSCFPKDIRALVHTGREHKHDMKILQAVDHVNRGQAIRFTRGFGRIFRIMCVINVSVSGGSRSSRRQTTCATRRRFRSLKTFSKRAPTSSRTILQPWTKQREFSEAASHLPRTITTAWKEPTLCCSLRSGRRFGTPISNE